MKYDVISFDLQGTISCSKFSDGFWLELLPFLYAKKNKISVDCAKQALKDVFSGYGKYDYRYYSVKYWMDVLGVNMPFSDVCKIMPAQPFLFEDMQCLIKELHKKVRMIVISSTTHDFIKCELGGFLPYFEQVYSSFDDFGIAGKPPELYHEIARVLLVKPQKILHIGDDYEMDIANAGRVGLDTFYFDKNEPRVCAVEKLRRKLYG